MKTAIQSLFDRLGRYLWNSGLLLFANLYSQFTFDAALVLKTAGLLAATTTSSTILDIGSGLLDAYLVVDVTALEIDSNDESYEVVLQGSPDSDFGTAANIVPLASITVGNKSSTRLTLLGLGTNQVAGRYVVPFRNEVNGTTYRYVRLKTSIVGTIATGINFSAFIAKDD